MGNPQTTEVEQAMESIYRLYAALACDLDPETGLGGKLLYVGEPAQAAMHLLRAANIAGAASIAASADAASLRRAMREGALDFVVTSLDEALRILKNEIRKKQPVAVGVSVAPEMIAREMTDRGVQPDILASGLAGNPDTRIFVERGAKILEAQATGEPMQVIAIPSDWNQPVAEFDLQLLESLSPGDHLNRRWVRLAPRYLPAAARKLRSIASARP
jgi:uncharacterized Rossmann fold enzyme